MTVDETRQPSLKPLEATQQASERIPLTLWEGVALAGILILGLALRAYDLGAKSLWLDELVYARSAYGDGTLLGSLGFAGIVHPPGYLFVVRLVALFMGRDEWLLRLPALLASTAGIVGLWATGRFLLGRAVGLLAALLLALSVFHIRYAQEVHSYALFATLSTMMLWALYRAARREAVQGRLAGRAPSSGLRSWVSAWAPFLLIAGLNLYVHYYAVFPVVLSALIYPFLVMQAHRLLPDEAPCPSWRQVLGQALVPVVLALILLVLLYLPQVLLRLGDSVAYAGERVAGVVGGDQSTRFTIGPGLIGDTLLSFATGTATSDNALPYFWLAQGLLVAVGAAWLLASPARRPMGVAAVAWLFLPLLPIAWLAQRAGESFAARRLIFALPVYLLLLATGVLAVGLWASSSLRRNDAPQDTADASRLPSPGEALQPQESQVLRASVAGAQDWALLGSVTISALVMIVLVSGTLRPLVGYFGAPRQDWRGVATLLKAHVEPGEPVFVPDSLTAANLAWYYEGDMRVLGPAAGDDLRQACSESKNIYAVAVPSESAKGDWPAANFVEVPLYRIGLSYRSCQPGAWYGDGARELFELALAQESPSRLTQRAYLDYLALSRQQGLVDLGEFLRQQAASRTQEGSARVRLGIYQAGQGNLRDAVEHFRQAAILDPANRLAYIAWSSALAEGGQLVDALNVIDQALAAFPDDPALLQVSAGLRGRDPAPPPAWQVNLDTGRVALQAGNLERALEAGRMAASQVPSAYQGHVLAGDALRMLGRPGEALAAYQEAARVAPQLAHVQARLSEILLDLDRAEEALDPGLNAVVLEADNWQNWLVLGRAYAARAAEDAEAAAQAEALLRSAIILAPSGSELPRQALADFYTAQGRPQDAAAVLEN